MSNTVNNYTETDLGNISLNPRGEYDNSAVYEYLDTVSYKGGSYFCLAELETTITGITPDAGRNSEHWQMIAAPGDMTPEYTAAHNDVIKKAVQVEASRAAVELAQQEMEAAQTDVQQLHSDTAQMAQQAENSKNSAANSAQSAEQSRKTVSESEQNINGQITGFDSRVSEAIEQSKEEINTTKQQAVDTITNQQNTSVNAVKAEGEKIITRVENDAKTVADDRATVEEAVQTVLNNAQEVAQNTQIVASNTENAAASAESAKTSADNAAQSAKSVEDASKQIEQNKKDVASLKEDITSKADKTSLAQTDRKLDALWKLNQGISYEFQTDDTKAYQKTVPSGAKVANVKSIGGKTIVWNQLCGECIEKSGTISGVGYYIGKYISFNGTIEEPFSISSTLNESIHMLSTHKYLTMIGDTGATLLINLFNETFSEDVELNTNMIYTPSKSLECRIIRFMYGNSQIGKTVSYNGHIQLFDLTQMFGSGNEPSTPEEFEAMFPADYYPYNAGELMSAPVNEIVEQGRNLFDCYGFSSTSIRNINTERDIANDYGTTLSTIDPINRLIVTQNKADGSPEYSYENGYFCIGIRGLKHNTNYILAFDFTPTKMLIANPIVKLLANGKADGSGQAAEFSLNVKKHVTIEFTYTTNDDMQSLELRNSGMSGIIENFQIEEGTTVATYSPYHKTSYPIPQAILNLPGYGWSAGDVRNEVNWENKQYIQRVTKYTFQGSEQIINQQAFDAYRWVSFELPNSKNLNNKITGDFVSDGFPIYGGYTDSGAPQDASGAFRKYTDIYFSVPIGTNISEYLKGKTIYYELVEIVTDISNIIGNTFQEPLEVEAGGTLTFKNSNGDNYRIPVPSSEEYVISLAEVAK